MSENKTQPTNKTVTDFLNAIEDHTRRADCFRVKDMMERLSGQPATMWGAAIVGFGNYHYRYESGREGVFFRCGFSPRKQNLTLYIMSGFPRYADLMARLGKYKTGKSCLYIKSLVDVDEVVLETIIARSLEYMSEKYGAE